MNCPKCNVKMEKVNFETVEIDKCTECKGIWFDLLEVEELLKIKGSEKIDDGNIKKGKEMNKIEDINCPKCGNKMTKMVDRDQPHIWFEKCVNHGLYFDAGEFKDLKEKNISDIFKSLIVSIKGGRKY